MISLDMYWDILSEQSFLYYFNNNNVYFRQMYDNDEQAKATVEPDTGKADPAVYSVAGSAIYHLVNGFLGRHSDIDYKAFRVLADLQVYSPTLPLSAECERVEFTLKKAEARKGVNALNPVRSTILTAPTKQLYHINILCLFSMDERRFQRTVHYGKLDGPMTVF